MQVAIAGDDARFCAQLSEILAGEDYAATIVPHNGRLIERLAEAPPRLLVLVQPDAADGVKLVERVRAEGRLRVVPIFCLMPRSTSSEAIACLDAGADDFMNRPFNGPIFLARVRTLLRRRVGNGDLAEDPATMIERGGLSMKLISREVTVSGKAIPLTRLEFDLLSFLARHSERVFKREELLESVWNYPQDVETRTLDKHIETLRRKLGTAGGSIQTVHGVGYRFASPAPRAGKDLRR